MDIIYRPFLGLTLRYRYITLSVAITTLVVVGGYGLSDNYNKGKPQLDFKLLPEGRNIGLTPTMVGQQVCDAFFGSLAMRQLRGINEVEVRVKLPLEERKDIYHLENFLVRTPEGIEVPLMDVVEVTGQEAFTSINH